MTTFINMVYTVGLRVRITDKMFSKAGVNDDAVLLSEADTRILKKSNTD